MSALALALAVVSAAHASPAAPEQPTLNLSGVQPRFERHAVAADQADRVWHRPVALDVARGAPQALAADRLSRGGRIERVQPAIALLAEDLLLGPPSLPGPDIAPCADPVGPAFPMAEQVSGWCVAFYDAGPEDYRMFARVFVGDAERPAQRAQVVVRSDAVIRSAVNGQRAASAMDAFSLYAFAIELAEDYGDGALIERDPETGALQTMQWWDDDADALITVEIDLYERDDGLRPR